jgi:hypothetical protein
MLAMSESELMSMVPPRVYQSIKNDNPAPVFKAFVVGGEGEWKPNLVGIGQVVQRWFKSAVQALSDKLKIGTPVFNLHAATNEHSGRTPIGEVVGKSVRRIKDMATAVAVAYIFPPFQDMKLDVASIEADVQATPDEGTQPVEDVDILDVTGIALGNSEINKPAFPGATLLASLQAFAEKDRSRGGNENMTTEELRQAIREAKLRASDLFSERDLSADPAIIDMVREEGNRAGYKVRKYSELEEQNAALLKEKKALEERVGGHEKSMLKVQAKDALAQVLKDRPKLAGDAKFSKFLNKAFEKDFAPVDASGLRRDLDKFVDAQVIEFREIVGEPGGKTDTDDKGGEDGKNKTDDGDKALVNREDFVDPKKNDFIPS